MFEYVVELLVAVILALAAVGVQRWRKRPGKQCVKEALERSSQLQQTTNELQHRAASQRATLYQAKNCGSILTSSEPWSSTILYETTSEVLGPKQSAWVAQPIDGVYRTLLHEAFEQPCILFHSDELQRSILKNLFESDGVGSGALAIVKHTPGKIFYLVVEFSDRLAEGDAPRVEEAVRGAVTRYKTLLGTR